MTEAEFRSLHQPPAASPQTGWPRRARTSGPAEHQETTLSCLHVILEEEWEHHRYAVRDLDAIDA